jgi:lactoylglutathione lyase
MAYRYVSTRLLVVDFAACYRFYRDALGFRPMSGSEHDAYADFDVGSSRLSLYERNAMNVTLGTSGRFAADAAADPVCLVLAVDDVDVAWAHLEGLGVRLAARPTDHRELGTRTAHVRDPDGNLIELIQPLDLEPQR